MHYVFSFDYFTNVIYNLTSHVPTPCSPPSRSIVTSAPFAYPSDSLGKAIKQFPRAIEETALEALNPAETTTGPLSVMFQTARINLAKLFFCGKSSPNVAFIYGRYGDEPPIIVRIDGLANNSNPIKQADGLHDNPNNI